MVNSPSATSGTSGTASSSAASRLVIDAPTRMFHGLFAVSFVGAYVTAESEHWRLLHVTLGYAFAGLLVFRVVYGIFGPRQAGLGLLWRRLAGVPDWLRSLLQARSLSAVNWRQGQNLTMALAIVSMLVLVVPLVATGYGTYNDWGDALGGDWLEEAHELFSHAFLMLVLAHVSLIAGLSLLRRQNQALPMITGRVRGNGPNLVRHNRAWLAGLLLLAVLALGAWQWQESPGGLIPTRHAVRSGRCRRGKQGKQSLARGADGAGQPIERA
jgi:cytochrome b